MRRALLLLLSFVCLGAVDHGASDVPRAVSSSAVVRPVVAAPMPVLRRGPMIRRASLTQTTPPATDLATWRASDATWRGTNAVPAATGSSFVKQFGISGDDPLSGDVDGDGLTDLVVWRSSTATWHWLPSGNGYDPAGAASKQFGQAGDKPLLGDMDGDGRADLVVWRPGTAMWYWRLSSASYAEPATGTQQQQWGDSAFGDIPLITDINGDGHSDVTVWRASTGTWFWLYYQTATAPYSQSNFGSRQWGDASWGDVPVVGDIDGDRRSELTVWRASTGTWFWRTSISSYESSSSKVWISQAGGDVPFLADADADGMADLMLWRGSSAAWYWLTSSSGFTANAMTKAVGANGDIPLAPIYLPTLTPPTLSPAAGEHTAPVTVSITADANTQIVYTLDGSTPTASSSVYTTAISLSADGQVRAAAIRDLVHMSGVTSGTYSFRPAPPTASPGAGTYTAPVTVTLATVTPSAAIYWTSDGTEPTTSSNAYTGTISVSTGTVLKAIAVRGGWPVSSTTTATYVMNFGTTPAPEISPAAGTYTTEAVITLTAVAGATIRYTVDGTDPTTTSTPYTAPFSLSSSGTLKARAWLPDYTASAVVSAAFTIQVAAPTLLPSSGSIPAGQLITVATATPGATITYTLNGVDPIESDASVASGGTLVGGSHTYKAKAWKAGATPSPVSVATYTTSGRSGVPAITGGPLQAIAVRADGTVWTWGDNGSGALGDGTTIARRNPVPIALSSVRAVSAGWSHTSAVLADATVRSWGVNVSGEVGDGTTTSRWLPTVTTGLSNVVAIDCGYSFTLALRATGTVATWGYNGQGQLGDGTEMNRFTPVTVSGLTGVVAVAGGLDHSLALKTDGTVWAWGDNASGQLGDGTATRRLTPVQVSGLAGVVAIDAGFSSSVALKSDGTVWTWGANGSGQLGDGTVTNRQAPVQMTGVTNAIAVVTRYHATMVLKADNTVWTVGENIEGLLGTPGPNRSVVAQVTGLPAIAYLGAGDLNGYVLTADGSAWAWGRNSSGNIGDGTTIVRGTPVQIAGPGLVWLPWIPVITLPSGQYTGAQSVVITNDDASAVMRYTTTGATPTESDPVVPAGTGVPISDPGTLIVRSFKTGAPPSETASATYTLKVVGPSFSPGSGTYASAQSVALSTTTTSATIRYTTDGSTPTTSSSAYSTALTVAASLTVKAFATRAGWVSSDIVAGTYWVTLPAMAAPTISPPAGTYATQRVVAITSPESGASIRYTLDGTDPTAQSPLYLRALGVGQPMTVKARVFKAGHSAGAVAASTFTITQTGLSVAPTMTPAGGRFTTQQVVTVTGPAGATLRYTTTGVDPTVTDGTIASGATVTVDRSMVLKVRAWETGLAASVVRREDYVITGALAAGENHSIALKADGTVWTWGDGYWSQIGDGGTAGRTSPVQVVSGAVAIAAGFHHSLVLKADGTVWAWGENSGGEVGDGTTAPRSSPVLVTGLTNVVALAGSFHNSYALKADGTVWAWGPNASGQIGDGTTTTRLTPVQVPGLTGVKAIAAGHGFALALVSHGAQAGAVWAWGANNTGQLGDGSTSTALTPQQVAGATRVKSLIAGLNWAGARTADDELLLWGSNDSGQMANGVLGGANTLAPVRTAPWMGPLTDVSAGYSHALTIGKSGRMWGWGRSCEYQLAMGAACQYRPTAEEVPSFPNAALVMAGGYHTLAVAPDGQVWAWGYNGQGALGDGTLTWRSTPTQVPGFTLATNTFLAGDQDNDGLSTWREYQLGTDPLSADTDGDGIPDGTDIQSGDGATDLDPDGDGLSNALETALGTDPYNADTDGDTVPDGLDAYPRDATRTQAPAPDPNDVTPPVITLIYPTNARPVGGGL